MNYVTGKLKRTGSQANIKFFKTKLILFINKSYKKFQVDK